MVFRVFPGLNIIHRAGEVHSNVDPLSRLPRILPHQSPAIDGSQPIQDAISGQPIRAWESMIKEPALKATCLAAMWEEVLELSPEDPTAWAVTRREVKEVKLKGAEEKEEDKQKEGQKGPLRPHRMPQLLWDVASLDLITGLPQSLEQDTILVILDKLMKYAPYILPVTSLLQEGFTSLFIQYAIQKFSPPLYMIVDRDAH